MEQKVLLLFANQYSIVDESTGVLKEGVTMSYILNSDLQPMVAANGALGLRPAKGSVPIESWKKITCAPAVYQAKFEMRVGSDGKPALAIIDLDYVSDISLEG